MVTTAGKQIYSDLCTGCRSCEVACSFHHTRSFSPARSSITVSRDYSTGEIWLTFNLSCDHCINEEEPLCIKFCPRGVLSADGLRLRVH